MIEPEPHSLRPFVATFGVGHWFGLPLALRRRWWKETAYSNGERQPSAELVQLISDAIQTEDET